MSSSTDKPAPKNQPFSCSCGRKFESLAQLIAHRQRNEC